MTSAAWCDRITYIHTFRNTREPKRIERVHEQSSYVNFEHNAIFNIPAILYANFNRGSITPEIAQHLSAEATYLIVFPLSTINQLMILTIDGLNQGGDMVISNTLLTYYERLHIIVEEEIADKRERCRLEWLQKICDSWEVNRAKLFYPEDYGWLQYRNSSRVEAMKEQFLEEVGKSSKVQIYYGKKNKCFG
jgi:hypothetical protein